MKDCYYYEFDRRLLEEENNEEILMIIKEKAKEYEELEYELIRKERSILNISPKVLRIQTLK